MKVPAILAVISVLTSITTSVAQVRPPMKDTLSFRYLQIDKSQGNCDDPHLGCINISLSYPVISGGNLQIKKMINQQIYTRLIQLFSLQVEPLEPDAPGLNLAIQQMIADWELDKKEANEIANWYVLADGQIAYQTNRVLVYNLTSRVVTNDNYREDKVTPLNFDLRTGKLIQLKDLVTDSLAFHHLVMSKVQETFAELNGNKMKVFDFELPIPKNFEMRSTGIFLWFNPMEAPLNANGPISIYLTYDELEGVLRREKFF